MKDFKKRSLVLMLASVIAVTGSFAADNYKNCLMDMDFKVANNHEISVVLNTQKLYDSKISLIRRDSNTYIIMLPEMDSSAPTPDLTKTDGNIESVEIKKMPYSNGSKGYTRITIKTAGNINLTASSALYIPSNNNERIMIEENTPDIAREIIEEEEHGSVKEKQSETGTINKNANRYSSSARPVERYHKEEINYDNQQKEETQQISEHNNEIAEENPPATTEPSNAEYTQSKINKEEASHQKLLTGLLAVFVIITSIYFYLKAQDKLNNVIGEKFEIDLDEEDDKKKKINLKKDKKNNERKKQISRAINQLDAAYGKNITPIGKALQDAPSTNNTETKQNEEQEELNIVDLDAVFKEQSQQSSGAEEGNEALDDFLNSFSYDDNIETSETNSNSNTDDTFNYDEAAYEEIVNNNNLKFNEDDIMCFNELLQSELSTDVVNNISKYAISNPIKPQRPSKEKILADIVTEYSINRNLTFTPDDINIIKELLSVEIDPDFVTDLRTNPQKTVEMEKSILEATPKKSKPTEILTLNVRDLLPNLADELKQQGNRPIKSEAKPQTVYFNEGYEVSKISMDLNDLPDLSKELNNKNAYSFKPSEAAQIVDNNYINSTKKLTISGLPDLEDVLAHPDKYEEKTKEEYVADENALLNSIANVQFKPFDDGTRNFEIINNFEDSNTNEEEINIDENEIRKELSQFENFSVANEEEIPEATGENYDDFEALYNQEYFDLDTEQLENQNNSTDKNQEKEIFIPERQSNLPAKATKLNNNSNTNKNNNQTVKTEHNTNNTNFKCIIEGISYDIINSVKIGENIGCHLAKSENNYVVLTYKNSDLKIIKEYDSLKSEKIQARIKEEMPDGTIRHIIKIGLNKFLVDLKDGNLNYVMDL